MQLSPLVLVVEDDPGIQSLLAAVVRRTGCEAALCEDGDGALRSILEREPDAILLDLLMPQTNGFAVLRYLKKSAPHLLPRTIVVTAAGGSALRRGELSLVSCVMRKPLDIQILTEEIGICLSRRGESAPVSKRKTGPDDRAR